jgi:hypothetical protein
VRKIVGPVEVTLDRAFEGDPYDLNPDNLSTKYYTTPIITKITMRVPLSDGTWYERDATELIHEVFERENYCADESQWVNRMWNYTGPWYPGSQKPAEPKNLEEKADKEEEKKDETPPKRRNLTSWPPTPE